MTKEYRQTKFQPAAGATELLLVRHGESAAITRGESFPMKDGQGDPELHEEGRQQAVLLADRLKHHPIKAIYASTLRRTQKTAEPLSKALGLPAKIDADLREVHLGTWESGLFRIKEQENDPILEQCRIAQRWDPIPGAESNEALQQRLVRALDRIRQAHPDELVVAVVHGGVIGQILAYATGTPNFTFLGVANASINKIILEPDRIILRSFNDTAHLEG